MIFVWQIIGYVKVFIKYSYIYIFMWFSERDEGPKFVTVPGSISPLSGPAYVHVHKKF
jgi:hypothetical protein